MQVARSVSISNYQYPRNIHNLKAIFMSVSHETDNLSEQVIGKLWVVRLSDKYQAVIINELNGLW